MSPTKNIKIDPARICVLEKQNQWRGGGIKHSKITPGQCGDDQVVPHPTPRDNPWQRRRGLTREEVDIVALQWEHRSSRGRTYVFVLAALVLRLL
jgi:hypothetical protein